MTSNFHLISVSAWITLLIKRSEREKKKNLTTASSLCPAFHLFYVMRCWARIWGPTPASRSALLLIWPECEGELLASADRVETASRQGAESFLQSSGRAADGSEANSLVNISFRSLFSLGWEKCSFFLAIISCVFIKMLCVVMFSSLKENLVGTQDAIHGRENTANILERHFSLLESTFVNMQWRLSKLARQWQRPYTATILFFTYLTCIYTQSTSSFALL